MLSCYGGFVLGDLPVHCVQPQTLGVWRFHVGSYGGDAQCGYHAPDDQDGHHDLTPPVRDASKKEKGSYWLNDKFKEAYSLEVILRDWTSEVLSVGNAGKQHFTGSLPLGEWTMVYDEGFHVAMKGDAPGVEHSFFAFYKYMLGDGDSPGSTDNFGNRKHSYCGTTLLGWYKRIDPVTGTIQSQECFWGERISTLEEAIASNRIPPPVAPVAPMPLDISKDKAIHRQPTRSSIPAYGKGPTQGGLPAPGDDIALRGTEVKQPSKNASTMSSNMRMLLQVILGISVLVAATGMCMGSQHKDTPATLSSYAWRVAILASMITAAIVFAVLWTHRLSGAVATVPPSAPVGPLSAKAKPGVTIKQWAANMHAEVQAAKQSGKPVRWTSDPEQLKAWLKERREKHGIEISEDSEVVQLLDLVSPQLAHAMPGFGNNEVIGPQRAAAIQEQKHLANKLDKDLSDLTNQDLHAANMTQPSSSHHDDKSFSMNGKPLAPDGWKTLTNFDWREVSLDWNGQKLTDFVNDVPDQGGCGSCYAVSATSMITSRAMLKYPELHEKFASKKGAQRISVHQQLNCNLYNQGCGGEDRKSVV